MNDLKIKAVIVGETIKEYCLKSFFIVDSKAIKMYNKTRVRIE